METDMITVAFWQGDNYTEKEYTGETCAVPATIDMIDHLEAGGWCQIDIGNRSYMVTSLDKLYHWFTVQLPQ